jgi:hypothetical protein
MSNYCVDCERQFLRLGGVEGEFGPVMRPADYKSIVRKTFAPAKRPKNYVSMARRAQPVEGMGAAGRPANYVSMARRAQPGALGAAKRPDNRFVSLARRAQPAAIAEEMTGPSSMRIDRPRPPDAKIPAYMENRKEIAAYVPARASAQARAVAAFGSERGNVRVYNAAASQPVFVRVIRVREDYICRDPTCHRALVGPDSATYRIPAGATGNIEYRPFSWRERATPGLVQRVFWSVRPFPPTGPPLSGPNEQLVSGTTLFTVGAGLA